MNGVAPGGFPWITTLTFLPLAGALAVLLLGRRLPGFARALAVAVATAAVVVALVLWHRFDPDTIGFPVSGVTPLGALSGHDLPRRRRRIGRVDAGALGDGGGDVFRCLVGKSTPGPGLLRACALARSRSFRHLHSAEFRSLVSHLGIKPHSSFLPGEAVGRKKSARIPTQFFLYTMVGSIALLLSFLAIFLATGNSISSSLPCSPATDSSQQLSSKTSTAATAPWFSSGRPFSASP